MANKNKDLLKTGIRNIPIDKDFDAVQYHFGYSLEKKDISKLFKAYIKKNYSKEDYDAIMANAEWNFSTYSGVASAAYWMDQGKEFPKGYERFPEEVKGYINNLILKGKGLLRTKRILEEASTAKKFYTPQQRLLMKIDNTVMMDIDKLEDEWYEGEKTTLDIVTSFRINELKGMAVNPVVAYLNRMLPEYEDAHSGVCKQAKEAYAHLGKRELTRRIKCITTMIDQLQEWKLSQAAKRKKRTKK